MLYCRIATGLRSQYTDKPDTSRLCYHFVLAVPSGLSDWGTEKQCEILRAVGSMPKLGKGGRG